MRSLRITLKPQPQTLFHIFQPNGKVFTTHPSFWITKQTNHKPKYHISSNKDKSKILEAKTKVGKKLKEVKIERKMFVDATTVSKKKNISLSHYKQIFAYKLNGTP